ncbi:hypothetical protein, partial [Gordonia aichiensis]
FLESRVSPWVHRRNRYVTVSAPSARELVELGPRVPVRRRMWTCLRVFESNLDSPWCSCLLLFYLN